jgi:RNA polymerase sigma-70 factor (ECF subfamily)
MKSPRDQGYSEWLVINSQLGDERAFDELLRYWHNRLLLYGAARLRDREQAREALQDCLLAISRGLYKLRDPASFPKWAFQIMDRRCTDLLRQRIRERGREKILRQLTWQEPDLSPHPLEQSLNLEQALQRLDEPLARLLRLYYLEGFAVAEIADITNIPTGTVKSRLFHARKLLAKILED